MGLSFGDTIHQGFAGRGNADLRRGGIAAWLLSRLRRGEKTAARLAVIERVTLAPRQFLVLVEADGQHLLVATSQDGPPSFHALGSHALGSPAKSRGESRSRKSSAKGLAA